MASTDKMSGDKMYEFEKDVRELSMASVSFF